MDGTEEMKIKHGVVLGGLHPLMRPVLRAAELIWVDEGKGGITITSALDGTHSASSWHYYGLAVDLRTFYFSAARKLKVAERLRAALPGYDVVVEKTHIHVEIGNDLAKRHNLYF